MKFLTLLIATILLCSCGASSSSNPLPTAPGGTPTSQLSWKLASVRWVTAGTNRMCKVRYEVTNNGSGDSSKISISTRQQYSVDRNTTAFSDEQFGRWNETSQASSNIGPHETLSYDYQFGPDGNGEFRLIVWITDLGYVTHDKAEANGQWSQQFFPSTNG